MRKILFLFPVGGDIPKRSAEVMAHIIYEGISKENEIFIIAKSKDEIEFAKKRNIKFYDMTKHRGFIFNIILRTTHLVNIDYLFRKIYKELFIFVIKNRIDIIIERHGLFNIGYILKRNNSCKYFCTEKLAFPDLPYYVKGLKKRIVATFPLPWITSLQKLVEGKSFMAADKIISKHEEYDKYLIKNFKIPYDRFIRYYAFVDKYVFTPSENSNNEFVATYVGSFDELHSAERLVPIIHAANKINSNIRFKLIGSGPMLDLIKAEIKLKGLSKVCDFLGRVNHTEVIRYIRESTVCFETICSDRVKIFGADSIKIYEYMACGKIIIASDLPGQVQHLKTKNAAILLDPMDSIIFAKTLNDIYHNLDRYSRMGINARQIVEESWNNDYTAKIFLEAIRN